MDHRSCDRMSWERTDPQTSHSSEQDQILVFGYSAKLFKDDAQADQVERGRHLVPWQGQADVRIDRIEKLFGCDSMKMMREMCPLVSPRTNPVTGITSIRFDVRGCLSNLQSFEPDNSGLTLEDVELEQQLDDERFRDLVSDEVADAQDEEIRRLREELAADGAYNEVGFSYDDNQVADGQITNLSQKDDCDSFIVPENLNPPVGLILPKTMREHKLIEKTALFIHSSGPQMEIVLKIKQSSNAAFAFLDISSPLNQYFRYILSVIKSGKYVPKLPDSDVSTKKVSDYADSESDSDDGGGYLHPSLMGGSGGSTKTINSISVTASSSHHKVTGSQQNQNVTVCQLEQHSAIDPKFVTKKPDSNQTGELRPSKFSILPPPPPDVQLVIDKLAERVAQDRGEKLESTLRQRADPRFEFLNPGNCFHAYYVKRKLHYIEQKQHLIAESKNKEASGASCSNSNRNISFAFTKTAVNNKVSCNVPGEAVMKSPSRSQQSSGHSSVGQESVLSAAKKLQEERKRKAALFLSLLKTRDHNDESQTHADDAIHDREHQLSSKSVNSRPSLSPKEDIHDRDRRSSGSRDRRSKSRDRSIERSSSRKRSRKRHRSRSRSH